MGEYYEEKPFKIHAKRKQYDYGEILDVITKNNENIKRKNTKKALTMTDESKRANTTIKYPRERKKLRERKMVENNSKLLLSGKCDFDPEEILDKLLLFNLKKNK